MVLFRDQHYFCCEYCGSLHFPPESEEGVRVLDQAPEELHCPLCHVPLFRAQLDKERAFYCNTCKGFLAHQLAFGDLVKYRRARVAGKPEPLKPLNQQALQRRVHCPLCGQRMYTHPYYGPGNIVIDSCSRCHVVWLDHGELTQVINAPGRDRPL
jgi:Zn-finger nucleic acid-binding protein